MLIGHSYYNNQNTGYQQLSVLIYSSNINMRNFRINILNIELTYVWLLMNGIGAVRTSYFHIKKKMLIYLTKQYKTISYSILIFGNHQAMFIQSTRMQKFLKTIWNHVGINWIALTSTIWWVPMCQGFNHFSYFCIILYWPNQPPAA